MTDQEHAEAIRNAVMALLIAVDAANDVGLTVIRSTANSAGPQCSSISGSALFNWLRVEKISREMNKDIEGVTDEFLEKLLNYRWPGNVRELDKVVKRAIILADDGESLSLEHLAPEVADYQEPVVEIEEEEEPLTLKQRIEAIEQSEILEALKRHEWNKSRAAIHLGISYPNLLSKIKRYNIQ